MPRGNRRFMQDLTLRASGLLLLALGALTMRHLLHLVHVPPRHAASTAEMGFAAIGFMSLSAGAALASLGAHIFDQVEISGRWARRPVHYPETAVPSREDRLVRFDPRAPVAIELAARAQAGSPWANRLATNMEFEVSGPVRASGS